MIFVYRIFINLILILSPFIILIRLIKKKEDFTRFKEKFCFFTKKRSKGKLIWFHGASVGEFQSIVPLLEKSLIFMKFIVYLILKVCLFQYVVKRNTNDKEYYQ